MSDIYTGVDCCEDTNRKGHLIHIYPTKVRAKPGQVITFEAREVTRECDPGCIYWRIISGGGRLAEEFGFATHFVVDESQEYCSASAILGLFCQGNLVSTADISVNEFTYPLLAYYKATQWTSGYYPTSAVSGQYVQDPETGIEKPVYTGTYGCMKFSPDPAKYGNTNPKSACLNITGHDCTGKRLSTLHLGIRNQAVKNPDGTFVLLPLRWHAINPNGPTIMNLGNRDHDFAAAKEISLAGFGILHFKAQIPTQYTIPPKLPDNPTAEQQALYDEQYKIYKAWMDYIKRLKAAKLTPGGIIDMRTPDMLKENCCPPEVQ